MKHKSPTDRWQCTCGKNYESFWDFDEHQISCPDMIAKKLNIKEG